MKSIKRRAFGSLFTLAGISSLPAADTEPVKLTIAQLDPKFSGQEVTLTFTATGTGGVAQLARPGKPITFIIETEPAHPTNRLQVWVEGDLADVMERLNLGLFSPNLKKGTVIEATAKLQYDPPLSADATRKERWYYISMSDWRKFRIIPDGESGAGK